MQKKGFTLIELLLVTAIILTIVGLMCPVMFSVRKKALVVSCQSNLRQINIFLLSYATENEGYIPRTCEDIEAKLHREKLKDVQTGIPSLKGLIAMMAKSDPGAMKILRCPADRGSYGQDYYPTRPNQTCWQAFGQSQQVNVEMYEEIGAPGYNPAFDGPMYGADPVMRNLKRDPTKYMVISDMWSHWHSGIAIEGETAGHFINLLFFDGHVGGKGFESSLEARRFLNSDGVKRWWIPDK